LHALRHSGIVVLMTNESAPNIGLFGGERYVAPSTGAVFHVAETNLAFGHGDDAQRAAAAVEREEREELFYHDAREAYRADIAYPLGYFGLQTCFANSWARLSDEDFSTALKERTTVVRITRGNHTPADAEDPKALTELLADVRLEDDPLQVATALYNIYLQQPYSAYAPPKYPFGAFIYTTRPDIKGIQLHFDSPQRGSNPFADSELRHREFAAMLEDIAVNHPDAQKFLAGTWLFKIPGFRQLFPPDIQLGPPPQLRMAGDSLWGQFLNRDGEIHNRLRRIFTNKVYAANTTKDLLQAFPAPVLFTNDDIRKYYEYYKTARNA